MIVDIKEAREFSSSLQRHVVPNGSYKRAAEIINALANELEIARVVVKEQRNAIKDIINDLDAIESVLTRNA